MQAIIDHMNIILYVSGALTLSIAAGIVAPHKTMQSMFGVDIANTATAMLVRHWCFMIAVGGGLLIWAGADEAVRAPVLTFAILGKSAIIFTLIAGHKHLGDKANPLPVIIADGIMVIVFALYLIAA